MFLEDVMWQKAQHCSPEETDKGRCDMFNTEDRISVMLFIFCLLKPALMNKTG